jgi:hypothetical protein
MTQSRAPGRAGGEGGAISIGALRLSVPGADRGAGQRIAENVARGLSERVPPGVAGRLGRLEITVRPDGAGEAAMTRAVVEAVLRALPRSGR